MERVKEERERDREREREREESQSQSRGCGTEQERRSSFPAWAEANKPLRSHVGAVVLFFPKKWREWETDPQTDCPLKYFTAKKNKLTIELTKLGKYGNRIRDNQLH